MQAQLVGRLREEGPRRGLDADRRLSVDGPVGDVVEVEGEDLLLGPALVHGRGELGLADLAREGAVVGDVEVLDHLLGDRRAALDDLAGAEVLDGRPEHGLEVDALVLVEAPILDRHGRLLDETRDLLGLERRAQRLRLDHPQALAALGVQRRVLPVVELGELGELGRRAPHGVDVTREAHAEDDPGRHEGEGGTSGLLFLVEARPSGTQAAEEALHAVVLCDSGGG